MITDRQLALIAPNCPLKRRREVLPHLNKTLRRYGIDSLVRAAAFLANVLVESGEFRYTEEIWGNTPAQRRYDTGAKARDLGNTPEADGDGKRHKGYGWIQTTGARNQSRVMLHLGLRADGDPSVLGTYPYCALSAGYFWQDAKLNQLADALSGEWDAQELAVFKKVVRRINGGQMHLNERVGYYRRALHVLRTVPGFSLSPVPSPASADAAASSVQFPAPPSGDGTAATSEAGPEERVVHTQIIDYAAQQVSPSAAKTFARSSLARLKAPLVKLVGLLAAALQANSIYAWFGLAVAVGGAAWLLWHYRRPVAANFYYLLSKLKERFA